MYLTEATVLLALLPFTLAATCNLSNAQTYIPGVTGVSNNTNGSLQDRIDAAFVTCTTGCNNGATCLQNCLSTACGTYCASQSSTTCRTTCLADPCSAFYGSGSATPDATALAACYKAAQGRTTIEERAVLDCADNQGCYKEDNGNYFCLDVSNGDYVDYEGGRGNVRTGAYTSGVPDAGASSTTTSAGTRSTSTSTGTRATSTSGTTTAPAAASTTATNTNAGGRTFAVDSALGLLGVAFALVL